MRRDEGQERVIGTLLGANNDGILEITNAFPVPHTETDAVSGRSEKTCFFFFFFFYPVSHTVGFRLELIQTFTRPCSVFIDRQILLKLLLDGEL